MLIISKKHYLNLIIWLWQQQIKIIKHGLIILELYLKDALKALYKKTLYHKTLPEGGIDHSVPPSFKLKIPYYNDKFNFTLLDENNKPMDFDLDYLQEKIVDKCYIKCIFNPVIWLRKDKNFGITYNVVALQIIENSNKDNYKKNKKKSKEDSSDNPNKIENYFGTTTKK